MTLKLGIALQFLLKLGNHKPHCSDFHVVWKANNGDLSIALSPSEIFGSKRRNFYCSTCCETFAFKYITLNDILPGQDKNYPRTQVCRTFCWVYKGSDKQRYKFSNYQELAQSELISLSSKPKCGIPHISNKRSIKGYSPISLTLSVDLTW